MITVEWESSNLVFVVFIIYAFMELAQCYHVVMTGRLFRSPHRRSYSDTVATETR